MIKTKHGWFAACVAVLVTLAFYLVWDDKPLSDSLAGPKIESSGPSVSAELPKTMPPTNPFHEKLDAQEQRSFATPHMQVSPNASQDPFKAFLEKQSEMVHQSPFVK